MLGSSGDNRLIYQAGRETADVDITGRSSNAGRTDTRPVHTRATIMTGDELTQVDRTVSTNEAGSTTTLSGAVARGAVTARVIDDTVRRGTCTTDVR